MTIKVGEIGKVFRYATHFDMRSSTSLTLRFTDPHGNTKDIISPRVTAPGFSVDNDPFLGQIEGFSYMQFVTGADDFDIAGTWTVCGIYTDNSPKRFIGDTAKFEILAGC